MNLVRTFSVGHLICHTLEGGRQRLDGGAMFGVVPKPLWERRIPADDRNRIPLALRCLLIEHDDGLVLVDTGLGNKENEKFIDIYGVENAGTKGPTQLDDALAEVGYAAADIKWVVNTHLHFDHAGGNTVREAGEAGEARGGSASPTSLTSFVPQLAFPEAFYVVQRRELDFASHTNERTAASYLPHNFDPVTAAGRWQFVDGETQFLPGIRLLPTPGHVPYHQSVVIESGGETACFVADLIPTQAHVPLPWIMGYDVEPLVTLETKRTFLTRAEAESWLLVFEHDPDHGLGRVVREKKGFAAEPVA